MYCKHVTDFHHVSALGHDRWGDTSRFSLVTLVAITLSNRGGLSRPLPQRPPHAVKTSLI
jgi:hypothetical protein